MQWKLFPLISIFEIWTPEMNYAFLMNCLLTMNKNNVFVFTYLYAACYIYTWGQRHIIAYLLTLLCQDFAGLQGGITPFYITITLCSDNSHTCFIKFNKLVSLLLQGFAQHYVYQMRSVARVNVTQLHMFAIRVVLMTQTVDQASTVTLTVLLESRDVDH